MKLRYSQIRKMDVSNGPGIGVSVFTSGCPYHCKGCHNSSIWPMKCGKEYTDQTQETVARLVRPEWVTRLSILGGEPLMPQNVEQLMRLTNRVREEKDDIEIWLWTGAKLEDIMSLVRTGTSSDDVLNQMPWDLVNIRLLDSLLYNIDVLVDGRFELDKRDITLAWKGSSNQRVIDMDKLLCGHMENDIEDCLIK